jgi:hypothetical protein
LILSGNNVSTWKDKSGTGNNATANTGTVTTNSTKINGLNTIRFNTSSFLNIASFTMTANISVFAVLRGVTAQETGPKGYFFLGNGAQPSFFVYTLPPANGNLAGPFSAWVATTGETNWYMPSSDFFLNNPGFIYTDNNSSFVNGSQLTFNPNRASVPNAVSAGAYSIQVGGRVQSDSLAFDFAECIFYNRTITAAQRQQVEGYLSQKWGLTGSLPAGHPGLTSLLFRIQQPFLAKKQYFTAFSPRQIPGCILWLDAADASSVTTSGTTVTAIRDKSARATVLTSPAGFTYPNNIFNGSYPSFYNTSASGGRLGYNTTYSLGSQNTVFIVGQLTSPSVGNQFFDFIDGYTSSSRFFLFSSPNFLNNYVYGTNGSSSGQVNGAITTAQMTSPFCWSVAFDTSTTISSTLQYVNGTQLVQSPSTLGAAISSYTGIIIGQRFTQSSESVVGHICEFIIFNNVLTATQRQQVESYLAQKWGLVSSLPTTGHIHNTFPAGSPTAIQPYVASVSPLNLKFIAYPTGTPTVNTPTNTTTTLNMTWNAPTFTTSWSARQITRVIITSYTVYVLADGSLAATLSPGNVLSTTYSPMTSGVAYSFYVRANGPGGQSAASATSSTVTYILPPGSPTVNTPTNTVSTLNMTWNAPVGGGQVTSYTVYVLAAGSLVSTLTPGFVTSTTFSPMTGDVAYSFYVSATGPGGTSSVSSTSATVTYSAGPMSYMTGVNFYTGTTAANWTNNWQPYLSAVFSCNAASSITTTQTRITVSNFVSGGWFLGVTCWDGSIYYAPYNGTSGILRFTPSTGFQGFVGTQVSYTGSAKWYTGVMGADSNIYFFGGASASILKYNPATAIASLITIAGTGGTLAANSYRGGILGPNGRIYLSPYAATSIFWFDPATVTSGNIATNSSSSLRYEGCSMGPDGKIYMSPFSGVNTMLILDTATGSVVYPAAGTTTAQTFRGGASLSSNGNLYFPPSVTNGNVLYYNSNTGGNLIANTSALVYRDSRLGPDGKVYITANNGGSNVIVVNPANNTLTNSNNALGTNLQGANMGLDGNIYGTPYQTGFFLKIQFNNVAYPFDSNYILSPYANHC